MRAVGITLVLFASLYPLAAQTSQNPDQLLKDAIEAQQRGDYQTAVADYRKVLELRPENYQAKVNLGAALVHLGQYDAAIAQYKSALATAQQKGPIQMNLALAYYKKGDFANARESFVAIHKTQPNDVRVAILLGDTYLHLGDFAAAVSLLEPYDAANSQNLDFQFVYASALIKSGKRRDGVVRMEKVAEAGHSADAYMLAGMTQLELNEFEPARRDIDMALQLDPKLPGIYTLAGTARDKTGDVKASEAAFREALRINPNDFDANLYLGAILYKRRDTDEAKIYLDRALKIDPKSTMARYEDAMLKSTVGQYEAAASEMEQIVADDPKWLLPHVELASLYYKLHRPKDGAREREIVDRLTAEQQAEGPNGKP